MSSFNLPRIDAPHPSLDPEACLPVLRARLEGAQATMRLAQALAENGEHVDLTGLDDQIGQICAGALDLPPAMGHALRTELVLLGVQVDALGAALHARAPSAGPPD